MQTVYSFSVKAKDDEAQELIRRVKEYCEKDRTAPTFSACVIQGLALLEEKTNGRKNP